ncbi:MAG TPA: hypothetical protein VNU44_14535 [Bryobacteraceae bacterium]|jgi:hypothetical protein|nr:hypothetical protein [Bryobacteraceae bacterium]
MPEESRTLKELQEENLRIQNEHLKQQTEFYAEQNEIARMRKRTMKLRHEDAEKSLQDQRQEFARQMQVCNHKKGGKGDDLKNKNGNDPNYAVIKHQYPWGEWAVICTRCPAEWRPGDTEKNHVTRISFKTAFEWPTDNTSSGSALFRIPDERLAQLRREHQEQFAPA